MLLFPNAKINIGLYVTEKRPDGYHNLESIFYLVPLRDAVEAVPASEFEFILEGDAVEGSAEDNLCVKAWRLMHQRYNVPQVKLALLKKIPSGAGLGGGSADAAFTLRLLNDMFEVGLGEAELVKLAGELGSDCMFFVRNEPAFVSGRGENIKPVGLKLKGYWLAVVAPGIHISTVEAYKNITPAPAPFDLKNLTHLPMKEWQKKVHNQFEDHAFKQYPQLQQIKEKLYKAGAVYASMSGSGSALYGIFEQRPELEREFEKVYVVELTN